MLKIKALAIFIIDLLTPRYITEDVAIELRDDGYYPVCSMADIEEGERFDGVVAMRSFTWLGVAWPSKLVGEVRPWE
ncbi:hypothetical protein [Aeromonas sp. R2-3]|uniref:hypothetical protein n=1 Tax=Aeromonas sp. R2-3 TaxID=3138461 RepID=UPI0034A48D11